MSNIRVSTNLYWKQYQQNSINNEIAEKRFHQGQEKYPASFPIETVSEEVIESCIHWAEKLNAEGISTLIVVGMGGSSLGAKSIAQLSQAKDKAIIFWEGTHPETLTKIISTTDKGKVALLWVSKSGTTLESRANLALFRQFFPNTLEYYITSYPEKIADLVKDPFHIFEMPKDLGGRFSVISYVGLLPAIFLDLNLKEMTESFNKTNEKNHVSLPIQDNLAKQTALAYYNLLSFPFTKVNFWFYTKSLFQFGLWLQQLWMESLGKKPEINADLSVTLGPEDQHSVLQYYMQAKNHTAHNFMRLASYGKKNMVLPDDEKDIWANKSLSQILNAQMSSIEKALSDQGIPISEHIIPKLDMHHLGKMFSFWMNVVTYLGYLFEINPFDQPGVEAGKIICNNILSGNQDEAKKVLNEQYQY